MTQTRSSRFTKFAWGVLAVNLLVILWGAVVRATGSGAGCGDHWPICNGAVIPPAPQVATLIEFFHRITSGIALILVVVMLVAAFRTFAKGHPARTSAVLSMVFMLTESLVGAFIVLMRLTAGDTSVSRAIVIAVHQINTLLLIGAIALTAWFATRDRRITLGGHGLLGWLMVIGVVGLVILGATGAITALGDTLFPASSLTEGWNAKFLPGAHFLVQLRVVHPTVAVIMAVYVTLMGQVAARQTSDPLAHRMGKVLIGLFFVQLFIGVTNVVLLAPVWMQLVHLLMADVVWIAFVFLAAQVLSARPQPAAMPRVAAAK